MSKGSISKKKFRRLKRHKDNEKEEDCMKAKSGPLTLQANINTMRCSETHLQAKGKSK